MASRIISYFTAVALICMAVFIPSAPKSANAEDRASWINGYWAYNSTENGLCPGRYMYVDLASKKMTDVDDHVVYEFEITEVRPGKNQVQLQLRGGPFSEPVYQIWWKSVPGYKFSISRQGSENGSEIQTFYKAVRCSGKP